MSLILFGLFLCLIFSPGNEYQLDVCSEFEIPLLWQPYCTQCVITSFRNSSNCSSSSSLFSVQDIVLLLTLWTLKTQTHMRKNTHGADFRTKAIVKEFTAKKLILVKVLLSLHYLTRLCCYCVKGMNLILGMTSLTQICQPISDCLICKWHQHHNMEGVFFLDI